MSKKLKLLIAGAAIAVLAAIALYVNLSGEGRSAPPDVVEAALKAAEEAPPPPPPAETPVPRTRPSGMGGGR